MVVLGGTRNREHLDPWWLYDHATPWRELSTGSVTGRCKIKTNSQLVIFIVYSMYISTVSTCPEFTVYICCSYLPWVYSMYISTVSTFPEFTVYICCSYLPWVYSMYISTVPTCLELIVYICCCYLPWV